MRTHRARHTTVASWRWGIVITVVALVGLPGVLPTAAATADAAATDAHVRRFLDGSGIPGGAYAIAVDGKVVHVATIGTAAPDGRPMTPQTALVIGSVGKSITALAVRQLVEAGAIDLDAPVTRYLPWFTLAGTGEATAAVTIRSLLDHTSGLSTADGQDPRWYEPGLVPQDVVRALSGVSPDRQAGSYEYSNLNYVVLGVVIEAVSGRPYGEYVHDRIFAPLGMTDSFTSPTAADAADLAQGHRYLFGIPVPFDEPYPTGMVAAGYQISTAEDMAHFVAALANGAVHDGVDIIGPQPPGTPPRVLGTDWQPARALDPGVTIGQSGSTLGSNADILVQPDRRLGVLILFNANPTQLLGIPAGAADLALDVLRLHTGSPAGPSAPGVRTVYAVTDALLGMLVLLFAVHALRARTWRRRLASTPHRRAFLGRFVVADVAIPTAVLLGGPLLIGATGSSRPGDVVAGWAFALWTLPDLAWVCLGMALGALGLGAAKLAAVRATPLGQPRGG